MVKTAEILENAGSMAKIGGWELDLSNMRPQWTNEYIVFMG